MPRARAALRGILIAALAAAAAVPAAAQERTPPGWTVSAEVGAHLPTVLYNERVQAELERDTFSLDTRYSEELEAAPLGRLTLRYNPVGLLGGYVGLQYASGATIALYEGGAARSRIEREATLIGLDFGISMRLAEWGEGRGAFGYTIGPILLYERIDLSGGHMDAFAGPNAAGDELEWTERDWRSWGFTLGVDVRMPVTDRLAVRLAGQDQVVGVNTSRLETLERDEVRRLTGRSPRFDFRAFTAHHPNLRIGVEYVLTRRPPRPPPPRIALPGPSRLDSASTASAEAQRTAVEGDTAAAVVVLRERVREAPEDASAWRSLGLLLAGLAEADASLRAEALEALQRAASANPGDTEVLAAYGRMRTLLQRSGRVAAVSQPLTVSAPVARADAAGVLVLAWSVDNVAGPRYRLRVEVVDDSGDVVPLRAAGDAAAEAAAVFQTERSVEGEQPLRDRLELRLAHARPGPYALRLVITDPATGQTAQGSAGFEIR